MIQSADQSGLIILANLASKLPKLSKEADPGKRVRFNLPELSNNQAANTTVETLSPCSVPSRSLQAAIAIQAGTKASADKEYKCQSCCKVFKSLAHLDRHQSVHTRAKNFKCPFPNCPRVYSREDSAKRHIKSNHRGFPVPKGIEEKRQN